MLADAAISVLVSRSMRFASTVRSSSLLGSEQFMKVIT
jgi:hypothetical protein